MVMKDPASKRGGHVHGRISFRHHPKTRKVTSHTIKIKRPLHTEVTIRKVNRSARFGRKIKPREKARSKYVGRKVRRRS